MAGRRSSTLQRYRELRDGPPGSAAHETRGHDACRLGHAQPDHAEQRREVHAAL